MAVLSYLFGALGVAMLVDRLFVFTDIGAALPWFAPAAAGLTGFFIAVVWYFDIKAKERAKKKRTKALTAMLANVGVCILAVAYLIFAMLDSIR